MDFSYFFMHLAVDPKGLSGNGGSWPFIAAFQNVLLHNQ